MGAPRCIVEIRWGKLTGTKVVIEPGGRLRVGRTERADLVVAHDGKMSQLHFELGWDGERCTLRDLGSLEGTKLGGAMVKEGEVPHGGWVQAGETDFMVYMEGRTPPAEEDEKPSLEEMERRGAAAEALEMLRAEAATSPLYAVLDGARDDRILELLREHVEPHRSLYEGAEGESLDEVAPYLVGPMQDGSALLEKLVQEGWGKRWGIWCTSREGFREVRRHWRRLLMVEIEETGEPLYFRFYDPLVMAWTSKIAYQTQKISVRGETRIVHEPEWLWSQIFTSDDRPHTDKIPSPTLSPKPTMTLFEGIAHGLVLDKVQMNAFSETTKTDFVHKVSRHLRCFFPKQCRPLTPKDLVALVATSVDRASNYGIHEAYELCLYATISLLCGKEFDVDLKVDPQIGQILRNLNVDHRAKVEEIYDIVTGESPDQPDSK
jgi:hypothetical protein